MLLLFVAAVVVHALFDIAGIAANIGVTVAASRQGLCGLSPQTSPQ